jgi:glycosyltransferase involved in cell wall biosynthesis
MTYIDAVPYDEVISYIQKAHVVLLPSFAEAFPMSWLEAMAMEKKLITSNIGWAKELMVEGETGCMVNPSDTEVFLIKMICLLENKEASLRMAKQARQRVKNDFDVYEIFQENINLYKNIL